MVAIAPYLSVSMTDSMTGTSLFAALNSKLNDLDTLLKSHLTITNGYNLELGCY